MPCRSAWCLPVALLLGCAPDLDWRDVQPMGAQLTLALPCKPSVFARTLQLAGGLLEWNLLTCRAAGATWSLGFAVMSGPERVGVAVRELRGPDASPGAHPWIRSGFTPNADAARWRWTRQLPDGRILQGETAVFVRGLLVYQASVSATEIDREAAQFFFDSLRAKP